ncbi:RING-H2 finger protein ATL33 [Cardamine amara subsp. amara]|uniref:RING-H2 finger protein ATL33 n=1 Tax=Cardamine amara subsp. amara TaxID=228776 RepID=A0ABD1B7A1_CARAN
MFNNTTTFFPGGVVPTPAATVPTTVFPGTTITSNSTFIIFGPPPPFPAPPRSIDLSPLKLIFAVIAIIAVPALAYALFFATPCSSGRRNSSSSEDTPPHATVDISPPITTSATTPDSGEKLQKDQTHSKEIGNDCSVCLSVLADGQEIQQLNACEHAFHVSCIEMWLKDHPNCPICRADVSVKQNEAANVTVNGNVNRSGGNRRVSATNRDDDWRQGLPDASSLV